MPRNKPQREIQTKFQVWWPNQDGGFYPGSGMLDTLVAAREYAMNGDRIMRVETIVLVEEDVKDEL